MEFDARVRSLEQQSLELHGVYEQLAHRLREIEEHHAELKAMHARAGMVRDELARREQNLTALRESLPRLARRETLDRLNQRLNAMPFELFVRRPLEGSREESHGRNT